MMNQILLVFYVKNSHGTRRFYPSNDAALAYTRFLGQKAMSEANIAALRLLEPYGITVELEADPIDAKEILEEAIAKHSV